MTQLLLDGDPPITINLRRNGRARQMSLRVSRLDGQVSISVPKWVNQSDASAFAKEKADWIRQQIAQSPRQILPVPGGEILFFGRQVPIVPGAGRSVKIVDGKLYVPGAAQDAMQRIAGYLKLMARQKLVAACDEYSTQLGRPYSGIRLRDTRTRWGSCTSDGNLMFSWRLIMAPNGVLEYVAAHEVAHLVEMNHSAAFWAVVERIYPKYSEPRQWLRTNGALLHAYRFRN